MNPEIWSFSINHIPWLPNKDILFPVTERPLGPNCRLFIKSRRRKDLFLQLDFDEASGDLAGQVGSTVSGWSHRSPIKYRHSRGVPTEQRPPLPMKEAHTCLTYIRKGLITWSAGPPQPVSTFVAGHMVAWAEEGEREKKQLGFLERLTPPDVVSTLGKKHPVVLVFVIFCVLVAEPSGRRSSAHRCLHLKKENTPKRALQRCTLLRLTFCGKTRSDYLRHFWCISVTVILMSGAVWSISPKF